MTNRREPTVIAQLRALMPQRPLRHAEALQIAERQASKLLELTSTAVPPVPEAVITGLPRVKVERHSPLPMSGYTGWFQGRWHIVLNGAEPLARQRFSLFHEAKHLIDHPFIADAYSRIGGDDPKAWAERVCDYFAGCVLMPKAWVKSAYYNRTVQDLPLLSRRFGVSQTAMRVRLLQLGLLQPAPRCRYRRADSQAEEMLPDVIWLPIHSPRELAA